MSFVSYTSGIPNPANNPSTDVITMQTNSTALATIWTQDHFGFNNNAGGFHKFVHLKNTAAPGGLGANANAVFYANTAAGQSWPFWQNALGSFQLIGNNSIGSNGFITLSSGSGGINPLVIQWGTIALNATGSATPVAFATTFATSCFGIVLTMINNQGNSPSANGVYVKSGTITTSGFSITTSTSSAAQSVFWITIGN